MNKGFAHGLIAIGVYFLFALNGIAQADDLYRARVLGGFSHYAFSLSGGGATSPDSTSLYFATGAGFTYATGKIYVDGSITQSIRASHDWPGYEGKFQRSDTVLTAGYLLDDGWSLFAGYKSGSSVMFQYNLPSYRLEFEANGPFIGCGKSSRLGNGVYFSYNAAIAFMGGDYETAAVQDSGDAIGLSLSAGLKQPFGKDSGIRLRGFYHSYDFSGFNTTPDVNETILGADINYYMDF